MSQVIPFVETTAKANREQPTCAVCVKKNDCILSGLAGNDASSVVNRVIYHAGDVVFEQGSSADQVMLISVGTVKTQIADASGDLQVLDFCGPGETLGLAPVTDGVHACSAVAMDTVSVCQLSRNAMFAGIKSRPEQVAVLVDLVGQAGSGQVEHLLAVGQKAAEQRLAAFLLDRSDRLRRAGLRPEVVSLPMSRAELGSYLALAVETVSRLLKRLQDAGLIEVRRKQVRILDEHGLRAVVDPAADLDHRGAA